MAFGVKTNERPGTRAVVRFARFSAYKARPVLDLVRGKPVIEADEILQFTPRAAAVVIRKCLASAVANAQHNDEQDPDELYVSACFADEGPTLRRFRPRARGRATRIRKRTCHITIIVSRMPEEMLERQRRREETSAAAAARGRRGREAAATRRERVRRSRQAPAAEAVETPTEETPEDEHEDRVPEDEVPTSDEEVAEGADERSESGPEAEDSDEPGERSEHGSEEE
jgi:large subunit ribosomal protein L22